MTPLPPTVLILDDEEDYCRGIQAFLEPEYHVLAAQEKEAALGILDKSEVEVALLDIDLGGGDNGIDMIREIRGKRCSPEVVVVTKSTDYGNAIVAGRRGASGYLVKGHEKKQLIFEIERARNSRDLLLNTRFQHPESGPGVRVPLVAHSPAMKQLLEDISRFVDSRLSILLLGESGVGKSHLARWIHGRSSRASGPFREATIQGMVPDLVEAELFGHERGAFTGAVSLFHGLLERARFGTLFLDEIGDLPMTAQIRLLIPLKERRIRRLGAEEEMDIDIRLISATNRDLGRMMEDGRFRQDLYFRVAERVYTVPPLRDRREDIVPLSEHFMRHHAGQEGKEIRGISQEAREYLANRDWPGNLHSLEAALKTAVCSCRRDQLDLSDFSQAPGSTRSVPRDPGELEAPAFIRKKVLPEFTSILGKMVEAANGSREGAAALRYAEFKSWATEPLLRVYCNALLKARNGNVSQAAKIAAMAAEGFKKLCARLGISPKDFRT